MLPHFSKERTMQHVSNLIVPILERANKNMLEEKHKKPYEEITISDMDAQDWQRFNDLLDLNKKRKEN